MVQVLLSLESPPRPDHAADALAIAICHANGAPHAAAVAESVVVPEPCDVSEMRVSRGPGTPGAGGDDPRGPVADSGDLPATHDE
jgi:hypothetical protein